MRIFPHFFIGEYVYHDETRNLTHVEILKNAKKE